MGYWWGGEVKLKVDYPTNLMEFVKKPRQCF